MELLRFTMGKPVRIIFEVYHIPYLGLWGRIGGFTEDFRPHPNEMHLLVIPLHTLWDIVDIRL